MLAVGAVGPVVPPVGVLVLLTPAVELVSTRFARLAGEVTNRRAAAALGPACRRGAAAALGTPHCPAHARARPHSL